MLIYRSLEVSPSQECHLNKDLTGTQHDLLLDYDWIAEDSSHGNSEVWWDTAVVRCVASEIILIILQEKRSYINDSGTAPTSQDKSLILWFTHRYNECQHKEGRSIVWQMSISWFIRFKPPKQKVTTEPSANMVAGYLVGYSDQMAKKHWSLACWPASAEALLGLGKHLKLHGNNKKKTVSQMDGYKTCKVMKFFRVTDGFQSAHKSI